jgi:predicted secreted hydrolase
MTPMTTIGLEGRQIPVTWRIAIPRLGLSIDCTALNAKSFMATSFPYWEGPISFAGSHTGVGYLEMTGY